MMFYSEDFCLLEYKVMVYVMFVINMNLEFHKS